jgi:hypothetical protein
MVGRSIFDTEHLAAMPLELRAYQLDEFRRIAETEGGAV